MLSNVKEKLTAVSYGILQMENVAEDVEPIRKALIKAYEEYWDTSEDGTSSPQLLFPEQSDSIVLQFINEGKWACALKYIRHNRITWLNDLISISPDDEDDVVNILTIFCSHLVETRQSMFRDTRDVFEEKFERNER